MFQTFSPARARWEAAGRHRIFRKQSILSSYQESADTWEYCHSQSAQADDTGLTVRFQFGGSVMNSREPVLALIQPSQPLPRRLVNRVQQADRKITRLNSSHQIISYAVFCLKKKKKQTTDDERIH